MKAIADIRYEIIGEDGKRIGEALRSRREALKVASFLAGTGRSVSVERVSIVKVWPLSKLAEAPDGDA